ncbi:MAG TPA: YWFCY domain-containing protein, partial [Puia sp.]
SLNIALVWLGLALYIECYWLFDHWHWTISLTDKLLFRFRDTGWLDPFRARAIALLFLGLSFVGPAEDKPAGHSLRTCLLYIGVGMLGYFGAPLVFYRTGDAILTCGACIFLTAAGFYGCYTGIRSVLRIVRPVAKEDPFGRRRGGFPQQEGLVTAEFSLHIPAEYEYKGEKKASWVNLLNPRRGILILGSPGSGKSRFIIEPLLRQWMQKGHVFFLYDFKYPALTSLAWEYFGRYRSRYPVNTGFYYINFTDLGRSHRCNLLDPATLEWFTDAIGVARTILLSMNASWVDRQGEFFVESPISFLGAIIWWLRKYREGQYCTLPHAIELAQLPYDKLFSLLNSEPDIQSVINPFIFAWRNRTFEMLDGQITSAKIPLARLASPNLYYILTGNDLNLSLNDPAAPKICCLGGDPTRQEALAPVLSLYIDRINILCNRSSRLPMAIICDEFATVRAYSMTTTIATGRSNNIVPVISVQDLSQLRTRYSKAEADSFLTLAGNLFCGQVGGETADWISKRFPRIQRERTATTENSNDTSVNTSMQWEPTITSAAISVLSSGEFVGLVADDPENELELKSFHSRLRRSAEDGVPVKPDLPGVHKADSGAAAEVFARVKRDIVEIADETLQRMLRDPRLAALIVRQGSPA